jgi:hypothetical protein
LARLRGASGTARGAWSKAGEAATLARWTAFQKKLRAVKTEDGGGGDDGGAAAYHGQVLDVDSGDERAGGDAEADAASRGADGAAGGGLSWARGTLRFVRHVDDAYKGVLALGGAGDGLVTVDPLRRGPAGAVPPGKRPRTD